MVNVGAPSPEFKLAAAVSEREASPAAFAGRKTVLVLHGPRTTDAPKEIGKAVRAAHPDASKVMVANIINLKSMGGMWKKVATAQINQNYLKMAGKMEANGSGNDPADYVLLVPDWDNEVAPTFGVEDSNQAAAAIVLAGDGRVLCVATENLVEQTLAALA